jgi:O-antigen/teichoic acid export membrane protein
MSGTELLDRGSGEIDRDEIERRTGGKALLAGGSILAVAMMATNAGNYGLNVLLGRWLGASEFADANLMVTLMLLVTAIAVSLQLISSRFAGQHEAAGTDHQADQLARWLEQRATAVGVAIAALLVLGAPWWSSFFQTRSAWPFVILGLGMPFYLAQGVGRGVLQGRLRFGPLAATFVIEMVVRLTVSVGLVAAGAGVEGATAGLSVSFLATWLAVRRCEGPRAPGSAPVEELKSVISYTGPVAVLLAGQIIINNEDVLIVKRFFEPATAGAYAGVALIGRAVFFLSWSVVTTIFPATTQREEAGASPAKLVAGGLGAVGAICAVTVVGAVVAGETVLGQVFGDEFVDVARYLPWYAFATSMFAIANLMASYELSVGRTLGPKLILGGAVLQTVLLLAWGGDLGGIIRAQVIAMVTLAIVTLVVIGRRVFLPPSTRGPAAESITNPGDSAGAIAEVRS